MNTFESSNVFYHTVTIIVLFPVPNSSNEYSYSSNKKELDCMPLQLLGYFDLCEGNHQDSHTMEKVHSEPTLSSWCVFVCFFKVDFPNHKQKRKYVY